jgi:hypothetical protein
VPWRVAIHLDEHEQLHYSTGYETRDIKEGARTLIFEDVQSTIPRIKDEGLRLLLLRELLRVAGQAISSNDRLLRASSPPSIYGISPYLYSPSLLDQMRSASISTSVRMGAFIHEGAALLVGTIQSGVFAELTAGLSFNAPTTLSLIAAYQDASVDVACFDYSVGSDVIHKISIRDFFHTTADNLRKRLKRCDWLDPSVKLVLLVSPFSNAETKEALAEALKRFSLYAEAQREIPELASLKMMGAAHVARCCCSEGNEGRYELDILYNIGVQVEQDCFHPILGKDEMSGLRLYPHTAAQILKVKGDPGNQMRLDLYCGQSDSVADGVLLDGFTLARQDLVTNDSAAVTSLALFATMKTPGSGEITLRLSSNDKFVERVRFTFPALVA